MITRIECENCNGIGTELCPKCDGNEKDSNGNVCSHCAGAGISICMRCGGRGTIEVEVSEDHITMGW